MPAAGEKGRPPSSPAAFLVNIFKAAFLSIFEPSLTAYGVTSRTPDMANAKRVLAVNRGRWRLENKCHYILDETFDEDRSRIRTGYGPENVTRLRRFAIGAILSKGVKNIAKKMRQLTSNVRLVFDYLGMTQNSRPSALRI